MNIEVTNTIDLTTLISSTITFIATAILIIVTRNNINKNANVNNQIEWARELRKEVAEYLSLLFLVNKNDGVDKLTVSACKIILLLNSNDKKQHELTEHISHINEFVITSLRTDSLNPKDIIKLRDLTHTIIQDKLKKINLINI